MENRLDSIRKARGWTFGQLSLKSGLSKSHLTRVAKGERTPSVKAAWQIARALGVSLEEIFKGE